MNGGGRYSGVDNPDPTCPACVTNRIVGGGYSDYIPWEVEGAPGSGGGAGSGQDGAAEGGAGGTGGAPPVPEPPACPAPPTPGEIAQLVADRTPVHRVPVSPDQRGVTGLDSWFWYEGPTTLAVSGTIRGYAVTATMWASRFLWDHGEAPGAALLASSAPGSRQRPAVTHLYERKGDYTVSVFVEWAGSGTYSAAGCPSGSGVLPAISTQGSRAYTVVEIRSVLTG